MKILSKFRFSREQFSHVNLSHVDINGIYKVSLKRDYLMSKSIHGRLESVASQRFRTMTFGNFKERIETIDKMNLYFRI